MIHNSKIQLKIKHMLVYVLLQRNVSLLVFGNNKVILRVNGKNF